MTQNNKSSHNSKMVEHIKNTAYSNKSKELKYSIQQTQDGRFFFLIEKDSESDLEIESAMDKTYIYLDDTSLKSYMQKNDYTPDNKDFKLQLDKKTGEIQFLFKPEGAKRTTKITAKRYKKSVFIKNEKLYFSKLDYFKSFGMTSDKKGNAIFYDTKEQKTKSTNLPAKDIKHIASINTQSKEEKLLLMSIKKEDGSIVYAASTLGENSKLGIITNRVGENLLSPQANLYDVDVTKISKDHKAIQFFPKADKKNVSNIIDYTIEFKDIKEIKSEDLIARTDENIKRLTENFSLASFKQIDPVFENLYSRFKDGDNTIQFSPINPLSFSQDGDIYYFIKKKNENGETSIAWSNSINKKKKPILYKKSDRKTYLMKNPLDKSIDKTEVSKRNNEGVYQYLIESDEMLKVYEDTKQNVSSYAVINNKGTVSLFTTKENRDGTVENRLERNILTFQKKEEIPKILDNFRVHTIGDGFDISLKEADILYSINNQIKIKSANGVQRDLEFEKASDKKSIIFKIGKTVISKKQENTSRGVKNKISLLEEEGYEDIDFGKYAYLNSIIRLKDRDAILIGSKDGNKEEYKIVFKNKPVAIPQQGFLEKHALEKIKNGDNFLTRDLKKIDGMVLFETYFTNLEGNKNTISNQKVTSGINIDLEIKSISKNTILMLGVKENAPALYLYNHVTNKEMPINFNENKLLKSVEEYLEKKYIEFFNKNDLPMVFSKNFFFERMQLTPDYKEEGLVKNEAYNKMLSGRHYTKEEVEELELQALGEFTEYFNAESKQAELMQYIVKGLDINVAQEINITVDKNGYFSLDGSDEKKNYYKFGSQINEEEYIEKTTYDDIALKETIERQESEDNEITRAAFKNIFSFMHKNDDFIQLISRINYKLTNDKSDAVYRQVGTEDDFRKDSNKLLQSSLQKTLTNGWDFNKDSDEFIDMFATIIDSRYADINHIYKFIDDAYSYISASTIDSIANQNKYIFRHRLNDVLTKKLNQNDSQKTWKKFSENKYTRLIGPNVFFASEKNREIEEFYKNKSYSEVIKKALEAEDGEKSINLSKELVHEIINNISKLDSSVYDASYGKELLGAFREPGSHYCLQSAKSSIYNSILSIHDDLNATRHTISQGNSDFFRKRDAIFANEQSFDTFIENSLNTYIKITKEIHGEDKSSALIEEFRRHVKEYSDIVKSLDRFGGETTRESIESALKENGYSDIVQAFTSPMYEVLNMRDSIMKGPIDKYVKELKELSSLGKKVEPTEYQLSFAKVRGTLSNFKVLKNSIAELHSSSTIGKNSEETERIYNHVNDLIDKATIALPDGSKVLTLNDLLIDIYYRAKFNTVYYNDLISKKSYSKERINLERNINIYTSIVASIESSIPKELKKDLLLEEKTILSAITKNKLSGNLSGKYNQNMNILSSTTKNAPWKHLIEIDPGRINRLKGVIVGLELEKDKQNDIDEALNDISVLIDSISNKNVKNVNTTKILANKSKNLKKLLKKYPEEWERTLLMNLLKYADKHGFMESRKHLMLSDTQKNIQRKNGMLESLRDSLPDTITNKMIEVKINKFYRDLDITSDNISEDISDKEQESSFNQKIKNSSFNIHDIRKLEKEQREFEEEFGEKLIEQQKKGSRA